MHTFQDVYQLYLYSGAGLRKKNGSLIIHHEHVRLIVGTKKKKTFGKDKTKSIFIEQITD